MCVYHSTWQIRGRNCALVRPARLRLTSDSGAGCCVDAVTETGTAAPRLPATANEGVIAGELRRWR
ncbi:hypothetical protein LSAT2_007963 [Lamellibrachia satsuma]|nr:hypothetical protein LSAT2_007963 [Lamellibrachia satsuma]